jgi:LacI family transcriptional regulator
MVMVDSDVTDEVASVDVDDEGGARLAAAHLLDLGHRDIAILAIDGPRSTTPGEGGVVARRLHGYRETLTDRGIDVPADEIAVGPSTIAGGMDAFGRVWDAGHRPTGVLAMSDAMAIGALRAIRDRGASVPADVSLVGFDDIDLAQSTDPPLTTVHQPVRGKGEAAVRLLLSVIEGRDQRPGHRRLDTRLIVRGSTGPVPPARQEVTAARPKSA